MKLRLKNPSDVRRALARITNMVINNELEARQANAAIYGCNAILASLRTDEQAAKIKELEEMLYDADD